jgi:hypothetical protein
MHKSQQPFVKSIGHIHFRTIDTTRYELWRNETTGEIWYHYPTTGSSQTFHIHLPPEMFVEPTGWAALMRKRKQPNPGPNMDPIMVVVSTAFTFQQHAEEIRACISTNRPYPLKYVVKRGADVPVFVENTDHTTIEIPPEYITSVLKKQEEVERLLAS